jgi:GT2 family glycosyltransferase
MDDASSSLATQSDRPLVSFVIVSWNCRSFLADCLRSIREHVHVHHQIIVVDNASTDGTMQMLAVDFPDVQATALSENAGFARGNNVGIRAARGRYLALVNPDVVVLEGCVEQLLTTIESDPTCGVVGPAMLDSQGRVRRSGMRLPSLWNSLCDALVLHRIFGKHRLFGGQLMADFNWTETKAVDVLNGWFWLIRRDAVEVVGVLDERFFMYGEDVDWCKRFRDAGWTILFDAAAKAVHHGGGSSRQAPLRFYVQLDSADFQYWTKHHSRFELASFRTIRHLHHGLRLAGYGAMRLVHPESPELRFKVQRHATCLRVRRDTIVQSATTIQ